MAIKFHIMVKIQYIPVFSLALVGDSKIHLKLYPDHSFEDPSSLLSLPPYDTQSKGFSSNLT